jgi:hypothetical protein
MNERLWLVLGLVGLSGALAACPAFPGDLCSDIPGVCGDGGSSDGPKMDVDVPEGCDLTAAPKDSPQCISDSVGVFVSPMGSDTAPGTKAAPVKTLTAALTKLGSKPRIYVCEGAYTDSATVTVPASIYGALKCADWSPGGSKPKITGAKSDFVVKVDSVTGTVQLVDVELYGKDGVMPGESSIALFANGSTDVKIVRATLKAGVGVTGKSGALMPYDFSAFTALVLKGKDASNNTGGAANPVNCPGGAMASGGAGGDTGVDGQAGSPMTTGGAKGNAGPMMSMACTVGGPGTNGAAGANGMGGLQGSLSAIGWTPSKGDTGKDGSPGGGGGGGGGQVAGGNSGGGGGGGGGGCGGAGGGAGVGGGASIAIATLDSSMSVVASVIASAAAGNGGSGVAGQSGLQIGGIGGVHGNGSLLGCNGGNGAMGGDGGAGGGGAGGVSVGFAYKNKKPTYGADTMVTPGTKGNGGTSPAGGMSNGADGVAQAELMVP